MSMGDQIREPGEPRPRSSAPDQPAPEVRLEVVAPLPVVEPEPAEPLPLLAQLAEDFATYDRNLMQPGLWAVVAHRLGERAERDTMRPRKLLLGCAQRLLSTTVDVLWGIYLPQQVQLGRRVRLWHSGCMYLNARAIGDDVHIRHDTTLGPLFSAGADAQQLPVIEARSELGAGVCVLGNVCVGHDSFVGANSLIIKAVPPNSVMLGVPARQVPRCACR